MFDDGLIPNDPRSQLPFNSSKGMNNSPNYGPISTRNQLLTSDPQSTMFNPNDIPFKGRSA